WYPLVWIPLSWEPIGLAVLVLGLLAFGRVITRELRGLRPSVPALTDSLPLWSFVFALAPWVALLVLRPVLYDEERHFTFAMPLLAVCAGLGLRGLAERAKIAIAVVVLASALFGVASWGRYAYVYRNPLLRTAAQDFKGDYWGVSSGAMA